MKNVQDIYPISSMQELMLLHALSRPTSDTLFNQFQFEIAGRFDEQAFESAWQALIDRHAALRTAFIWKDVNHPLQVVRQSVASGFQIHDLRTQTSAEQRDSIDNYLQLDRQAGFELHRAPLMRFGLLRLADERWFFVWTSHHLIVDRWCLARIYSELDWHYAKSLRRPVAGELPHAAGFREYIDWLSHQEHSRTLEYWADLLRGYEPVGSLTRTEPGSADSGIVPNRSAELELAASTSSALLEYSRKNALTPSIVAQAAWSLTLNLLLESQDVLFGITVSGRPAEIPDVESIIGSFVNNVPVRVRLPASARVSKWLAGLQAQQFSRLQHEYLSGAELQRHLSAERATTEFESLLVWLAEAGGTREIDMRPLTANYATAYPLTISILQQEGTLRVRADATKNCIEDLRQILAVFADALDGLVAATSETRLGDLPNFRAQPGFEASKYATAPTNDVVGSPQVPQQMPVAKVAGGRERLGTDVLRELVQAEWAAVLGIPDSPPDADFFELGGTSLQAADLHSRLEVATRQSFPLLALFQVPTVDGMVATVFREDWPVRTDIVNCVRAGVDQKPLFCVASPEVNTVGYSLLARHLAGDQGVYVLQSPPEDNQLRQVQPDALPELAGRYVASMQRVQPRGPYQLLGMCTGSHIALEMARQLEAVDEQVEFLGIINTWALYTISRLYYVNRLINLALYYVQRVRQLIPAPEFRSAAHAMNSQRSISSRAKVVTAESLEGEGSAWIHDVGFATKNPGLPKLKTRVSLFRLRRQAFWRIRDESLGWSMHVNDVDVVTVKGKDHDHMMREPYIREIATAVKERLRTDVHTHCEDSDNDKKGSLTG